MVSKLNNYIIILLAIIHIVGIGLFAINHSFIENSWFTILLSAALIFVTYKFNFKLLIFFSILFLVGFIIEFIGVNYGVLFGQYIYGDALGYKLLNVPIVIGLNWFAVITISCSLIFNLEWPTTLKVLIAGAIATLLDFLIEPVAIQYNFWTWQTEYIPLYNYVCWFIFSTFFAILYFILVKEQNKVAFYLFFIWIIFFVTVNFL